MENEDPSITFDRIAGENAMYRQLLPLLFANSPGALAALRTLDVEETASLLRGATLASEVFIEQAISVLTQVKALAEQNAARLGH